MSRLTEQDADERFLALFNTVARRLPRFEDGRADYTEARHALALNVLVMCRGKVLLMKRSQKVGFAQGMWHVVAGFLDEPVPLRAKVEEELREETGITSFKKLVFGEPYTVEAFNRKWTMFPTMVELDDAKEPTIVLDWEHTAHIWIAPEELKNYERVAGLDTSFQNLRLIR